MASTVRRKVVLTLLVACTLAILWLNLAIGRQQQTAIRTLNLVDRQRFLSQRVAGLALELATHANVPRPTVSDDAPVGMQDKDQVETEVRDQLRQATALMQSSHTALINNASETGDLLQNGTKLTKIYYAPPYELDHAMLYFLAAANAVADAPSAELNDQSKPLATVENAAREPLLTALNAAVSAYEAESESTLKRQRLLLGGVALAVIILTAMELLASRGEKS